MLEQEMYGFLSDFDEFKLGFCNFQEKFRRSGGN